MPEGASPLPALSGLDRLDASLCAECRARFIAAGYGEHIISAAEGIAPVLLDALRLPLVRRALEAQDTPAADLALLFAYRSPVARARVEAALGATLVAALIDAGVLTASGDGALGSAFMFMPLGGQWFLSDYLDAGDDAVMGPGMTTLLLHRLLDHADAGGTVLDLGCGAASLAIAAAAVGAKAVATDLSERAIELARFNARLNAVALDARAGDVSAPVAGMAFDLVLSQPPYVPCPDAAGGSTYLHGGRFGDELAMRFVAESARVLAPGGTALLHFDTLVRPGAPLPARLREVLGDAPVDLVALVERAPDPDQQAIAYAASAHPELGPAYAHAARAYRAHFDALGATEAQRVLVVLRLPRTGARAGGRYRIVLPTRTLTQLRGGAINDLLAALELASRPDAELLGASLAFPEGARFLEQRVSPNAEAPTRLSVALPADSIAEDRELGERGWVLLGLLGDSATVAEALDAFAAACEQESAQVRSESLSFVRESLARGLLRPRPDSAR